MALHDAAAIRLRGLGVRCSVPEYRTPYSDWRHHNVAPANAHLIAIGGRWREHAVAHAGAPARRCPDLHVQRRSSDPRAHHDWRTKPEVSEFQGLGTR